MIKPITIYGNPVLRKECVSIEKTYPGIREVIETMWQTLRNADGCGLAAPQINLPIKLFVVNTGIAMHICLPEKGNVSLQKMIAG